MAKSNLVFQEVQNKTLQIPKQRGNVGPGGSFAQNRQAIIWLSVLLLMIVCMVVVGGMTRLTDSGLSIVEWKPISGVLFPSSREEWLIEFEKYKLIPEFTLVNSDMTIEDFKYIYLWEWGHRQLGRAIGVVWFAGFALLMIKKWIPRGWTIKFLLIGVLIGFQGLIGWWMVYSGLKPGMTDVSSYRLATHLGMAFCIVGLILWYILSLRLNYESLMLNRRRRDQKLYVFMNIYLCALFVQIILGALVAGIDAGTAYTDWPLMAGELFPSDYLSFDGLLTNFLENPANVQFNHRISAYLLFAFAVLTFLQSRKNPINFLKAVHTVLLVILLVQVVLGIITVSYGSPYQMAIVHQLLALILWLAVIWISFETAFPRRQALV